MPSIEAGVKISWIVALAMAAGGALYGKSRVRADDVLVQFARGELYEGKDRVPYASENRALVINYTARIGAASCGKSPKSLRATENFVADIAAEALK